MRWVRALVAELEIPGLRACGFTADDIPSIVEQAARASSMKANPVELTLAELAAVVEAAM